jgi:hypothetical protein
MTILRAFGWLDGVEPTAETEKRAQVFATLIRARLRPAPGDRCTRSGKPMPPSGRQIKSAVLTPFPWQVSEGRAAKGLTSSHQIIVS